MNPVRRKILISAYACSPYKGSEPGVGWGFVSALAEHHDLWVIVEEEKFKDDIERYCKEFPGRLLNVRFFFVRKERNRMLRKIWPPSYYWYYRRWHWSAYELAQRLHKEVGFDVVHQLTMVGFREPGYLWKLDIPFVWGPIGGMGFFPWRFLSTLGVGGAAYYVGYNVINWLQTRFMVRPRVAARCAALMNGVGLIAATPDNQVSAYRLWRCPSVVLTEVGLPSKVAEVVPKRYFGSPLRIVWTGQHIPRKALNLALRGLAALPENIEWELHILGEGPKSAEWKQLSKTLGVQSRCVFYGWTPRDQALEVMRSSHLMLITSLRDLTSTVIVESLAMGVPVLCPDHCGFSAVVDESCGIKIPLLSPDQFVKDIAKNVAHLASDEAYRYELARGALVRSSAFEWASKAQVVCSIYQEKCDQGSSRVDARGVSS